MLTRVPGADFLTGRAYVMIVRRITKLMNPYRDITQQATSVEPSARPALLGRPDVILGALSGFALALAFGTPILSALAGFWSELVVPAFYTLAQAGLLFCG